MFRHRERSEELSDLVYDTMFHGLTETVWYARGHLQDKGTHDFLVAYRDFYMTNKRPSESLCGQASVQIDRALEENKTCLYGVYQRAGAAFAGIGILAAPVLWFSEHPWYAAGALAVAGVSYLVRKAAQHVSKKDVARVQAAITDAPRMFADALVESKEYMGEYLIDCGVLDRETFEGFMRKQKQVRRSKV